MQDSDFEFPPDQIDTDVQAYPAAIDEVPFSVLSQTPVDQLPRTHIPNAEHRSIRQLMRGALHDYHKRSSAAAPRGAGDYHWCADARNAELISSHAMSRTAENDGTKAAGAVFDEFSLHGVDAESTGPPDTRGSLGGDARHVGHETLPHSLSGESSMATATPHDGWGPKPVARVRWTEGELHDFYKALSQYGTDFGAMAVLFQHHTRQELKRLYLREMRRNPAEVRAAFENRTAIDLEQFNKFLAQDRQRHEAPKKVLGVEEEELLQMIAQSGNRAGDDAAAAVASNTSTSTTDVARAHRSGKDMARREDTSLNEDEFDFDDVYMSTARHENSTRASGDGRSSSSTKKREGRATAYDGETPPAQRQRDEDELSHSKQQRSPKRARLGSRSRAQPRSARANSHRRDESEIDCSANRQGARSGGAKRSRSRAAESLQPSSHHSLPSSERSPARVSTGNVDDCVSESPPRTLPQSERGGSCERSDHDSCSSRRSCSQRVSKQPPERGASATRSVPREYEDGISEPTLFDSPPNDVQI